MRAWYQRIIRKKTGPPVQLLLPHSQSLHESPNITSINRRLSPSTHPLLPTNIPPKDIRLRPIHQHQQSIPRTKAHIHIRALPEPMPLVSKQGQSHQPPTTRENISPIRERPPTREIPTQPTNIRHRPIMPNIRQTPLMAILKRSNLLHPSQLPLQLLNPRKNLRPRLTRSFRLLLRQLREFHVDGFGPGEGIEEAREEGTFLRGDLCGGSVVGDGAVADRPDVFGAVDDEVFVDRETAAGVLLRGDLGHEVFDDGAEGVTRGPDEEAVGQGFFFLGAVRFGEFGLDGFVGDVLDHCFGADGDAVFLEGFFGVVD